jgi:hypothetical protein
MTDQDFTRSLRRLYWLTGSFGLAGFVSYWCLHGPRPAFGFALGAVGSFGNLWLFAWLSRAIGPGETARRPWGAAAFIGRYLILFLVGYSIVKTLGVSPLAVILGLLASTAAVLTVSVLEIFQTLLRSQTLH